MSKCVKCGCVHRASLVEFVFSAAGIWHKDSQTLALEPVLLAGPLCDETSERPARVRRTAQHITSASKVSMVRRGNASRALDAIISFVNSTFFLPSTAAAIAPDVLAEVVRQRTLFTERFQYEIDRLIGHRGDGRPYSQVFTSIFDPEPSEWTGMQRWLAHAALLAARSEAPDSCEHRLLDQFADLLRRRPTLLDDWCRRADDVIEFRLALTLIRDSLAALSGFGTHNRTEFCQAFLPALFAMHGVRLDDIVVPLPWRGLGFAKIVAYIERAIVRQTPAPSEKPLTFVLFAHVHQALYAATVGRSLPGYTEWVPVAARLGDDPTLTHFLRQIADARGLPADANLTPLVYTDYYGNTPLFYDLFHILWMSPLASLQQQFTHPTLDLAALAPAAPAVDFSAMAAHFAPDMTDNRILYDIRDDMAEEMTELADFGPRYMFPFARLAEVGAYLAEHTAGTRVLILEDTDRDMKDYATAPARPWIVALGHLLAHYCTHMNKHAARVSAWDPAHVYRPVVALGFRNLRTGDSFRTACQDFFDLCSKHGHASDPRFQSDDDMSDGDFKMVAYF